MCSCWTSHIFGGFRAICSWKWAKKLGSFRDSKVRSRVQIFRPDQLFKVIEIKQFCYFSTYSPFNFNTLFNWYINLTIYPSQHFRFGAAFVCRAGNFWTLVCISLFYSNNYSTVVWAVICKLFGTVERSVSSIKNMRAIPQHDACHCRWHTTTD